MANLPKSLTIHLPDDLSPEKAFTISPRGHKTALNKQITRTAMAGGKARWTLRAQLSAFDPFLLLVER